MGNFLSPFTISLKLHLSRTTKVITKMDQQDIQHVPPDVRIATSIFFCKNTTFDTRITSDLLFRLMTLTDRNLNIKNYKTTNGLIKKLRNLTTGATATTASSLAVFILHNCMALLISNKRETKLDLSRWKHWREILGIETWLKNSVGNKHDWAGKQ